MSDNKAWEAQLKEKAEHTYQLNSNMGEDSLDYMTYNDLQNDRRIAFIKGAEYAALQSKPSDALSAEVEGKDLDDIGLKSSDLYWYSGEKCRVKSTGEIVELEQVGGGNFKAKDKEGNSAWYRAGFNGIYDLIALSPARSYSAPVAKPEGKIQELIDVLRDIDLISDFADFDSAYKLKEIEKVVTKTLKANTP